MSFLIKRTPIPWDHCHFHHTPQNVTLGRFFFKVCTLVTMVTVSHRRAHGRREELAPWKNMKAEKIKVNISQTKNMFIGCHFQTAHILFEFTNND